MEHRAKRSGTPIKTEITTSGEVWAHTLILPQDPSDVGRGAGGLERREKKEKEREIGVGEEARPGALRGGVSTYFVEWGTGAELAAAPAERCSN